MLPKIGDKFYIPDAAREFYCVKGGLATVEKIADDRSQGRGVKVKFAGIDTHWYTLEYIRENQAKWGGIRGADGGW